jgi:hypothetical protein
MLKNAVVVAENCGGCVGNNCDVGGDRRKVMSKLFNCKRMTVNNRKVNNTQCAVS